MPYPCQTSADMRKFLKSAEKVCKCSEIGNNLFILYQKFRNMHFKKFRQIYSKIQNLPKKLVNAFKIWL